MSDHAKDTKDTKDTKGVPERPFLKPNETTLRRALVMKCARAGLLVEEQVTLPLVYKRVRMPEAYRADFIVEKCLVVEVKCVSHILAVHKAQLLNYLRPSGLTLGLLLNFNVPHMKEGIHRVINGPERDL